MTPSLSGFIHRLNDKTNERDNLSFTPNDCIQVF